MTNLITMLKRHEGVRPKLYLDTKGIPTIAVGRNIRDVGLSDDEIDYLLKNDIAGKTQELRAAFPWFADLDPVRQDVVVDMSFMGVERFKGFVKCIEAITKKMWYLAAMEMLNSDWAKEVGSRATDLAEMMRSGNYPSDGHSTS